MREPQSARKKFTADVLALVETGATYMDAISTLARKMDLEEAAVPGFIEPIVKKNLEVELRELRLLKEDK